MKLNKTANKDYYLYLENGEITTEEKDENSIKIMDDNTKENSNKQFDFYENLSKYTSKLPSKRTFNKILTIFLSIVSLLLIIVSIDFAKNIKWCLTDKTQIIEQSHDYIDNIGYINQNLNRYYKTLYSKLLNNTNYSLSKDILTIENMIKDDLNTLKTLKESKNNELFKESTKIIEKRLNNMLDLCSTLEDTSDSKYIFIYNSYAKVEIEEQSKFIKEISSCFDKLGIKYSIRDDYSIIYTK